MKHLMRRVISPFFAIVILSVPACKTMRTSSMTSVGTAHRAWVTLPNQTVVEVSGPKVINDTLVGYVGGEFKEIPATDVKQIRVKEWNRGKTALVSVLGLTAFGAAAYAITSSGKSGKEMGENVTCVENPDRCATDPNQ